MDQEKEKPRLFSISVSPHIRTDEDTRSIMLDVLIAMVPALGVAAYMFGFRAILVTLVSCAACVFFEWAYRKLLKKPESIGDLSAVVTGTLLADISSSRMTTPASRPALWIILE